MKKHIYILTAIMTSFVLAACGKSSEAMYSEMSDSYAEAAVSEPAYAEEAFYSDDVYESSAADESVMSSKEASTGSDEVKPTNRKLIKTVNISAQTKEFDALIATVTERIDALGGYAESMDISGYEYNASETSVRSASIVARIPAARLDSFVSAVEAKSNITSKYESTNDVTLEYSDVEAHRNSLRVEQQRLNELLEEADSLETIIALEERLSEVRYELESYESRLKNIDNKVDYSTVYLDVREVRDYTPVVTEPKSFGQRLAEGFVEGCEGAIEGLGDFVIGFFSILPGLIVFLLILAIIGLIIFAIVRLIIRIVKKASNKKRKNKETSVARATAVKTVEKTETAEVNTSGADNATK